MCICAFGMNSFSIIHSTNSHLSHIFQVNIYIDAYQCLQAWKHDIQHIYLASGRGESSLCMHYNFSSIHLNYAIRLCYLAVSLSLSPIHFNGSGFGFLHFASNFFPSIYSVSYSFLVFSRYFGRHSIFYFSRLVVI